MDRLVREDLAGFPEDIACIRDPNLVRRLRHATLLGSELPTQTRLDDINTQRVVLVFALQVLHQEGPVDREFMVIRTSRRINKQCGPL